MCPNFHIPNIWDGPAPGGNHPVVAAPAMERGPKVKPPRPVPGLASFGSADAEITRGMSAAEVAAEIRRSCRAARNLRRVRRSH